MAPRLERTGFWIKELGVMLDAGVGLAEGDAGSGIGAIFVTHGAYHGPTMIFLPLADVAQLSLPQWVTLWRSY